MKEFQPFFPKCLPSISFFMKYFIMSVLRTTVFSNINIITLSHAELRQRYHIICYTVHFQIAPIILQMSFVAVFIFKSRLQLEILYCFWLSNLLSPLLYKSPCTFVCFSWYCNFQIHCFVECSSIWICLIVS